MSTKIDLENKKDAIFQQLKQFISEIIGADVVEELNITYDSIFTKDLEMDSIETVAFAEKINKHYGKKIDFISWLYQMGIEKINSLSVGAIIDLISEEIDKNS